MFWDVVQTHMKCCGVTGWNDWSAAKHLKNGQKVPESCCRDQENCSVYNPDSNSIYLDGCMSKLELPFKIAFWAIPSLMAFVLLSALVVCSRQKNREDRHHKNRYVFKKNIKGPSYSLCSSLQNPIQTPFIWTGVCPNWSYHSKSHFGPYSR